MLRVLELDERILTDRTGFTPIFLNDFKCLRVLYLTELNRINTVAGFEPATPLFRCEVRTRTGSVDLMRVSCYHYTTSRYIFYFFIINLLCDLINDCKNTKFQIKCKFFLLFFSHIFLYFSMYLIVPLGIFLLLTRKSIPAL